MYHYCNSKRAGFLVKDVTQCCVVLTKLRLLRVHDDKLAEEVLLRDILDATHVKATKPLGYDVVRVTTHAGTTVEVQVWGKDAARFFAQIVTRVVGDIPKAVKAQQQHQGRGQRAKTQPGTPGGGGA